MPRCVGTVLLEAIAKSSSGTESDMAKELLSARKTLAKRESDKEDVIETLTNMLDDSLETFRNSTTKEDMNYWQGVKDGLRKALILIDTEMSDLYRGILETSASGNRLTDKEKREWVDPFA